MIALTLCLLVSSADNLCKQFGPSLTKWQAGSGTKLFDKGGISEIFFIYEVHFEKIADNKKGCKITQHAKINIYKDDSMAVKI